MILYVTRIIEQTMNCTLKHHQQIEPATGVVVIDKSVFNVIYVPIMLVVPPAVTVATRDAGWL